MLPVPRRMDASVLASHTSGAPTNSTAENRAAASVRESERRYRDLYDEAPIAYIYEDLESRFVRANGAACRLLGIAPDDVTDTFGVTLLAPTELPVGMLTAVLKLRRKKVYEAFRSEFEAMY